MGGPGGATLEDEGSGRRAVGWEALAAWYDEKQGDEGDLWHRALIDPALLGLLGEARGRRLLDLACGNGYLCRRLARLGATVVGVDASAPIVERARAREARAPLGITYHVADAAHLPMLADGGFNAVVGNMAFMDIADAAGAIGEAARLLRPGGRLVASLSHPCFDVGNASAWVVERVGLTTTVWRKVSRYREPHEERIPWRVGPDRVVETTSYHRPLAWYLAALRAAGLLLTGFVEPMPTPEFLAGSPQGPWIAEIPLHCVLEATKPPSARPAAPLRARERSSRAPAKP